MISVHVAEQLGAFSLDVRFEAPSGATVLFGRSGAGKTSVIRAVAGLLRPREGRIAIGDRVLFDAASGVFVPPHRRRIGYVFQEARLFPHLDVRRNLLYGRRASGGGSGPRVEFDRIVALLGLEHLVGRSPARLSGGEMQRVAIGRALLSRPQLILADEPLSALDEERREEVLPYFERLRDEMGLPIIYVSHRAAEVARIATHVVVLDRGRVLREGSATDVLGDPEVTPTGPRGAGAVVSAVVRRRHEDGLAELDAGGRRLFVPGLDRPPGAHVRIRIAAQDVLLSDREPVGLSALNILPARVVQIRRGVGPGVIVALETPAGRILSRITQRSSDALGVETGRDMFAIVKTVSVAPGDIGFAAD